jgi:hypothetical protein
MRKKTARHLPRKASKHSPIKISTNAKAQNLFFNQAPRKPVPKCWHEDDNEEKLEKEIEEKKNNEKNKQISPRKI